jgi:hypothetical protein
MQASLARPSSEQESSGTPVQHPAAALREQDVAPGGWAMSQAHLAIPKTSVIVKARPVGHDRRVIEITVMGSRG